MSGLDFAAPLVSRLSFQVARHETPSGSRHLQGCGIRDPSISLCAPETPVGPRNPERPAIQALSRNPVASEVTSSAIGTILESHMPIFEGSRATQS
jgi:hypothetical protein